MDRCIFLRENRELFLTTWSLNWQNCKMDLSHNDVNCGKFDVTWSLIAALVLWSQSISNYQKGKLPLYDSMTSTISNRNICNTDMNWTLLFRYPHSLLTMQMTNTLEYLLEYVPAEHVAFSTIMKKKPTCKLFKLTSMMLCRGSTLHCSPARRSSTALSI